MAIKYSELEARLIKKVSAFYNKKTGLTVENDTDLKEALEYCHSRGVYIKNQAEHVIWKQILKKMKGIKTVSELQKEKAEKEAAAIEKKRLADEKKKELLEKKRIALEKKKAAEAEKKRLAEQAKLEAEIQTLSDILEDEEEKDVKPETEE